MDVRNFNGYFNKPINVKITFYSSFFPLFFCCGDNTYFRWFEWLLLLSAFLILTWLYITVPFWRYGRGNESQIVLYNHLIKVELIFKGKYVGFLVSNLREKGCQVGCSFSLWENLYILLLFFSDTSYIYDLYVGYEKYGAPENKGTPSKKAHLACIWEERSKEWD